MAIYNGGLSIKNVSISTNGGGNAITSLSADGNVITATKATNFLTSYNVNNGVFTGDLNTATTSGFYRIGGGQANSPGEWGQLIVCQGAGDTITQIYGDYGSGTLYTRSGNPSNVGGTGSWRGWYRLWKEGDAVTGAVANDLIDCIDVYEDDILEPGYCYCMYEDGHYRKSEKYLDNRYIGIDSDTYSLAMGMETGKRKLNAAVSGFILAYVDKEYPIGTALTCTENGYLTKIKLEDKMKYPERIIATYWKNESAKEWGPDNRKVKVNGRKWVKIK